MVPDWDKLMVGATMDQDFVERRHSDELAFCLICVHHILICGPNCFAPLAILLSSSSY